MQPGFSAGGKLDGRLYELQPPITVRDPKAVKSAQEPQQSLPALTPETPRLASFDSILVSLTAYIGCRSMSIPRPTH